MSLSETRHEIEVAELRYALGLLPQTYKVTPNETGNLAITNDDGVYVGWVDLSPGPGNGTVNWV